MSDEPRFIPEPLARQLESFVDNEFTDAARYENREVLDVGGVYALRRLVAAAYAAGFDAGERSEQIRYEALARRDRDRQKRSEDET